MHNLLKCSPNYSDTTGSLWFYFKDKPTNFNVETANSKTFESFKYEVKLLGKTVADRANGILRNAAIVMSLKNLSNFDDHWLIRKLNWNLSGRTNAGFFVCVVGADNDMLILIKFLLLSKTQNYISLFSVYK